MILKQSTFIYLLIVSATFFSACSQIQTEIVDLKSGQANLTEFDFSNKNASLYGETKFYPQQFIVSDSLRVEKNAQLMNTNFSWNNQPANYKNQKKWTYGSYVYKLKLPPNLINKSFIVRPQHFISYASQIYINNQLVAHNGWVGKTADAPEYLPSRKTVVVPFNAISNEIEIVVQAANYNHFRGGIPREIDIGLAQNMIKKREQQMAADMVIIISLLSMFVYHFVYFLFYTKDYVALFFSLTCLIFALDLSFQDEMTFFIFFPELNFKYYSVLHLSLPYLYPATFLFFIHSLFPLDVSKTIRNSAAVLSVLLIIITVFGTYQVKNFVVKPFYLMALLFIGYIFYVIYLSLKNRRPFSVHFLISFSLFSMGAVNDILLMFEIIDTQNLLSFGFFVFVFLVSIFQSQRTATINKQNIILANRLKTTNKELEQRVILRTQELKQSLNKLQALSYFKEELFQAIVHDLKMPLNVLINLPDSYSVEKRKFVRLSFSKQMLNLVLNILDVQKYETAKMHVNFKHVQLNNLIQKAMVDVGFFADNKSITLKNSLQHQYTILADNELIERVIVNLLYNAIKHSKPNSTVEISVEIVNTNHVNISIKDQGSGINEQELPFIFDSYAQISNSKSGVVASTGLGLAFCKKAIDAHHSQIQVQSEIGKGSTFSFHLKLISAVERQTVFVEAAEHFSLSEQDIDYLDAFWLELKQKEIHELTSIQRIIETIDKTHSPGIARWLHELEESVIHSNKQQFLNLLNKAGKKQ